MYWDRKEGWGRERNGTILFERLRAQEVKLSLMMFINCDPKVNIFSRWALIKDFLDIFKSLSAPYLLSEGSLLQFHRDFSTGEADVDFTLESWWWREGDNRDTLKTMLEDRGFTRTTVFGTLGEPGYEEAWGRGDIKVDLLKNYEDKLKTSSCIEFRCPSGQLSIKSKIPYGSLQLLEHFYIFKTFFYILLH